RRCGLGQIPRLLGTLARLQQVRRHIGPPHVDAEAFDETTSRGDGSAGLPEGTPLAYARLDNALRQVKRAMRSDLAHGVSFRRPASAGIRARTESRCGLLLNDHANMKGLLLLRQEQSLGKMDRRLSSKPPGAGPSCAALPLKRGG